MRDYAEIQNLLSEDLQPFTQFPFISQDMSVEEVRGYLQLQSSFKKLNPSGARNDQADRNAENKFLKINERLSLLASEHSRDIGEHPNASVFSAGGKGGQTESQSQSRGCDCPASQEREQLHGPRDGSYSSGVRADWSSVDSRAGGTLYDSILWDLFRDKFHRSVESGGDHRQDCCFESLQAALSVGPGASRGVISRSFYEKLFCSDLTYTHPWLLAVYRAAVLRSEFWFRAERQRSQKFGHTQLEGNRLFFVPKTTEISRTCCTEPLLNMMLQKAIGAFLESRLEEVFGISLSTQPDINRELARIGSIDGSLGTIDLASASDSISWKLVQRITPSPLIGWLRVARCEFTVLPSGELLPLAMISTMGNGFTFPLQTLIFSCAVWAVYTAMGFPLRSPSGPRTFGVFGDDIIVRREAYESVVRLLEMLGFEVNVDKSFNTGPFRESCGYDWYRGHYVRGVYITSLETVSDVYSAINRLNKWTAVSGIPLPKVVGALCKMVRYLPVPRSAADHEGIQVPFRMTTPKVTNRYWFSYRKIKYAARRLRVPLSEEESNKLGYRDFNPWGWAVATLGGYARGEEVGLNPGNLEARTAASWSGDIAWLTLRSFPGERPRTKVVRESIPYWDWNGPVEPRFYSSGAWESAVAANLP